MSNFLEAARWTDREKPEPHQRLAWEKAWGYLTPEEQREFLQMFRAKPVVAEKELLGDLEDFELRGWREVAQQAREAGALFPDLVSAQWALESFFGTHPSGRNNFWGLKGKGAMKTTTEFINGQETKVKDEFLNFATQAEGVQYLVDRWYKDFTTSSGKFYKGVNRASSREEAADLLQRYGYGTDPDYAKKLKDLMKRFAPAPILSTPSQQPTKPRPGKPYLRLRFGQGSDSRGLRRLVLEYVKDGKVAGWVPAVSGAPGHQQFRTGAASRSGSLEPLPEGKWYIDDIEWAGGKDNYGASWGAGLGPAFIELHYKAPGRTQRSAIGIHMDANQGVAPGTAGCLGISTKDSFQRLVSWLRETDPRTLLVDWGLGTCPQPE